jgi:hypothetical protein
MAAAVTATAIGIEWTADRQLRRFLSERSRDSVKGEFLATGIWMFGLAAAPSWWWTVAGPLAVTAMFLIVSITMMDRHLAGR